LGNAKSRSLARRASESFALGDRKKAKTLDYVRLLPHALRAIRCANVRSGVLPSQSGFRLRRPRNDEKEKKAKRVWSGGARLPHQ
jgi:hypothetical protein